MNEWDRLYLEINYLALLINRHTDYAVWINMVGHVCWTEIKVSRNKINWSDVIIEDQISRHTPEAYKNDWSYSSSIEKMTKIRDQLKFCLENGDFDYESFDKVFYEDFYYSFMEEKEEEYLPSIVLTLRN